MDLLSQLVLVVLEGVLDRIEILLHVLDKLWSTSIVSNLIYRLGHEQDMRKVFLLRITLLSPNLKVFFIESRSGEVDVRNLILHDQGVGFRNDSNEEVHENDEKNEDVEGKENQPNERDHLELPERILIPLFLIFDDLDPNSVLWSREITNGVPGNRKNRLNEVVNIRVIFVVETCSDNPVSSCLNEDEHGQ